MVERTFPRNIRFSCTYPDGIWKAHADATQVHQILLNLCINARDAMPSGGELTVAADNVVVDACYSGMNSDATPGHYVRLCVTDSGTGIPPALVDRVFDPFFTTKPPGQGTGLGLAAVQTIVRRHHGFVEVDTQPDRGTEFRVFIPATVESQDVPAEPPERHDVNGRGQSILLVDDERAIREIARSVLTLADFTVVTAPTGAEALRLFSEANGNVAAVIVDMVMPEMDGAQFIAAIHGVAPATPVIAMSGLPALRTAASQAAAGPVKFLQKPFTADELLESIHDALGPGTRSQS
jgi:CheY-like chemotaxis protein